MIIIVRSTRQHSTLQICHFLQYCRIVTFIKQHPGLDDPLLIRESKFDVMLLHMKPIDRTWHMAGLYFMEPD